MSQQEPEQLNASLSSDIEIAIKILVAYQSVKNLPPGEETTLPPIHYRHDTVTITVKRDAG